MTQTDKLITCLLPNSVEAFMFKTYDVILSDPPWKYSFSKSSNRKVENHYPTMTVGEICNIRVPAAFNSVLYLWATAPKLPEALEVMKAWGFKYKTHACWDKEKIGMGYWFRGQHELLLVGTKGKMSPPESGVRISSMIRAKRDNKHSKKPSKVYDFIERAFPEASKLEMFARNTRPGWDSIGNEIDGSDIRKLKDDYDRVNAKFWNRLFGYWEEQYPGQISKKQNEEYSIKIWVWDGRTSDFSDLEPAYITEDLFNKLLKE